MSEFIFSASRNAEITRRKGRSTIEVGMEHSDVRGKIIKYSERILESKGENVPVPIPDWKSKYCEIIIRKTPLHRDGTGKEIELEIEGRTLGRSSGPSVREWITFYQGCYPILRRENEYRTKKVSSGELSRLLEAMESIGKIRSLKATLSPRGSR